MRAQLTRPTQTNLKKADKDAIPMTFDLNNVKSTVTNPSQIFKGISVEDEQKISKMVNEKYPNWSNFEKQQALQWLYNAALNAQKQKDIDAWRQQIKLDWINKANNAQAGKEQNTYISQLKKADLADLIKDELVKQWYKRSDFLNLTDEWIIAWFLETNPEYKDSFNKFFYDNKSKILWNDKTYFGFWWAPYDPNDVMDLAKDLGWVEKDFWDKVSDKVEWIKEWMIWWLPKRWEWVKDLLDWGLAWSDQYQPNRQQDLEAVAFGNFVQDKYWTYPAALSDVDYKKAKKDFEASRKQALTEYTPSLWSAFTKMAMWLSDIALTSWWLKWWAWGTKTLTSWIGKNVVRNNLFKLWFSTLANDDYMSRAPEALWDTLSWVGSQINTLPWFSNIRDSLQTEQDKADWDAFVAWNVLALMRSWKRQFKQIKDADVQGWKQSFDEIKKWNVQEWVNTLKENAKENRANKYNEEKLKTAQEVSQWQIETRWQASKALDQLNEEWKLDKIKNVNDLEKVTDETVNRLKEEQTNIAKWEQKKFWQSELWISEDAEVLDNNWNKTTQKVMSYPLDSLLDRIIEHYDNIDKAEATKYKSYKQALKNWKLPAETILEIRREGNSLNQKVYNNKTNQYKDTDKAQQWAKNMEKVNKVIEWLDIGEDLRKRDSQLSALYTLQQWIKDIKKAAANYEKKAIKKDSIAKWLWKTVSRVLGKLSFGTTNFLSKALVSMLQESLWWWLWEQTSYNALEIANKVPEFVKDYKNLVKKIEWQPVSSNNAVKLVNAFIDKWNLEQQFNEED